MNLPGAPVKEYDQMSDIPQPAEIPSYPVGAEQYVPGQEATEIQPQQYVAPKPQVETFRPAEIKSNTTIESVKEVQESKTPELQTQVTVETTRSGERIFVNPELGQSTFKGGVTSQQLVSRVGGYYTVQQGFTADPKSGLIQQTATTGDPTNGSTWQASLLFKILQAFWSALGIGD